VVRADWLAGYCLSIPQDFEGSFLCLPKSGLRVECEPSHRRDGLLNSEDLERPRIDRQQVQLETGARLLHVFDFEID